MIGLAELIKLAAFADSCGVEVLEFSCRDGYGGCEMVGRHLNYLVSLDARSGVLSLHTSNADSLDPPQHLVSQSSDWKFCARLVAAIEFAQVASLAERPVEIVDRYGEKWVIA